MNLSRFPAKLFIAVLIGLFFASACFALGELTFPRAQGFVNDYANLLTTTERANFEELLKNYERETSNEVSLVIVDTFQGLDVFTYSQQLFTAWNIGKKDKNNGILFLIGPKEGLPFPERGEAFINVGRGLEGALTDSQAGTIIRNETIPEFKAKNYALGIQKGLNAIIAATKGEYVGTGDPGSSEDGGGINFTGLFWVGFVLLSYVASFLARTKSWWLGGVIGGVAGAIFGFIFWSGIIIALSAGVLGVFGLLFDFVLSRNYQKRLAQGKPTDFWHSGGGFWFGGGRGGFGGGGGGFGGFGGGMSGGGGAGGRW